MTREQLEKNIADNGGAWHKDGFEFTMNEDKTLYANRNGFSSFLIPGNREMGEWYISGSTDLDAINSFIRNVRDLAQILDFDLVINDRVERAPVHQEDAPISYEPLYRAEGKVEAYEKILLGRSVTISA